MDHEQNIRLGSQASLAGGMVSLPEIDPQLINNAVLKKAIERIQGRSAPEAHADYYTKHSSHQTHSKGW